MLLNRIKNLLKKNTNKKYPFIHESSRIASNVNVYNPHNLIMGKKTNIDDGAIIMNTRAKFIMGDYSGAAIGLLVITGNHMSVVGKSHKQIKDIDKDLSKNPKQYDKDIVVEEDVWLGARVTLLYGSHIKRGAIIGAGSVVRSSIPPYSIAIGNPAKVVGFRFTPDQIIQHEQAIYAPEERISTDEINNIYDKYILKRIKQIKNYTNI